MAWVKFLSDRIIFFGGGGVQEDRIVICLYGDTGKLHIRYGTFSKETYNEVISNGEWNHITLVKNGKGLTLYSNSVEQFVMIVLIDVHRIEASLDGIGGEKDSERSHQVVDEVKIFNRALSIEEITVEKNLGQPFDIVESNN